MRLIDADELVKDNPYKGTSLEWQGIVLARMVEDMPTIDPVGHGKWVGGDGKPKMDGFSVYCSSCGKWSEYRTRYCGECGAKMDKG